MGLRDINLNEEYRSDKDDIVAAFFFPCLNNCIRYDRCVDLISVQTLTTIAMAFENFAAGKAKLRLITGHMFKTSDLNVLLNILVEKPSGLDVRHIRDSKIQKLQDMVSRNQIEMKIAIPNSEQVANSFSERIGIFKDADGDSVAFTGTSQESFSMQIRDFESVDVFTSWNDESRVKRKMQDFEELWQNKTNHVDVYSFVDAAKANLLKYSPRWIMQD